LAAEKWCPVLRAEYRLKIRDYRHSGLLWTRGPSRFSGPQDCDGFGVAHEEAVPCESHSISLGFPRSILPPSEFLKPFSSTYISPWKSKTQVVAQLEKGPSLTTPAIKPCLALATRHLWPLFRLPLFLFLTSCLLPHFPFPPPTRNH
jgi:hypothetical protein